MQDYMGLVRRMHFWQNISNTKARWFYEVIAPWDALNTNMPDIMRGHLEWTSNYYTKG